MNCFKLAVISAAFMPSFGIMSGLAHTGERAPAIHVSQVISPANQSFSSTALAGKTIVLDFWATWCGPCVASMPHMNELEDALDPKKFVFIALDDEPEEVVQRFLTKRKILSIVALDHNKETFTAFGVAIRPATIVIDPRGRIALVTQPLDLTMKDLLAVSNGEKAAPLTKAHSKVASSVKPATYSAVPETKADTLILDAPFVDASLAAVSLHKKLPGERAYTFVHDAEGKQAFIGRDAKDLIELAIAVPDRRVTYLDELPSEKYDLTLDLGALSDATKSIILTAVVEKAFNLDIKQSDSMQDVLVLKRAEDGPLKLEKTFNAGNAQGAQQNGAEWAFSNFPTRELGFQIEGKYGVTVVDETGLTGGFEGIVHWPENRDQLDGVLRRDLGLKVTAERRSVATYIVSKHK